MHSEHDPRILLLGELVALRFPVDGAARSALRQRVCDFVDDRRAGGWPPERVVVAVKELTHIAGMHPTMALVQPDDLITTPDELLVQLVSWSIERYFAGVHDEGQSRDPA
ncbi:MAG: hypothetical protein ACREPM_01925 [Gemmatimonadaceae bacterium]